MECTLCSEGFQKFFNSFQKDAVSFEELASQVQVALSYVADEIHLGKVTTRLKAPVSVYEPHGIDDEFTVICCEQGIEDQPQKEVFQTGEKGEVTILLYPQVGYSWTEKDRAAIHFLAQNLFVILGRSRLLSLMKRAMVVDSMTGVSNTDGLMQFGGMQYAKGNLVQLNGLFINVKNFKYINQTVGARKGDEVLRCYCRKICDFLGENEIFARLGGDNFVALVKKEHTELFLEFLSEIQVDIFIEENKQLRFRMPAKAGIYPIQEGDTMSQVMNGISIAFAIAKKSVNHDYIWFRPQMLEQTMHDKEVSVVFKQAIENQEFIVYYQPKVTLVDNRLCGCEALVRWVRKGQLIPPMEFVPVLEREGTVCTLDFYVLERVCQDIRKWLDSGMEPVCVSVNFSKIHLHNQKLADDILSIIDKYQIAPQFIEVELTEMSGYEDFEALAAFVACMKAHGVNTSIDDFVTGYSSLNLLKDLNVDVIKLDRSFLNHIEQHNKTDEIVVKNIVNMVNELNMKVIAEGVETVEQAEFLKDAKCRMAQGFLFDKPLSLSDFEQRLSSQRVYEVIK